MTNSPSQAPQSRKRRWDYSSAKRCSDPGVAFLSPSTLSRLVDHHRSQSHVAVHVAVDCLGVGHRKPLTVVDAYPCSSMEADVNANDAATLTRLHPAVEDFLLNMSEISDGATGGDHDVATSSNATTGTHCSDPGTEHVIIEHLDVDKRHVRVGQFLARAEPIHEVSVHSKLCIDLRLLHSDSLMFERSILDCYDDEEVSMCVAGKPRRLVDAMENTPGGGSSRHRALLSLHRSLSGRLVVEGSFIIVVLPPIWSDVGSSLTWDLSLDATSALGGDDSEDVAIFWVDALREVGKEEKHELIPTEQADDGLCCRLDGTEDSYSIRVFCDAGADGSQAETEELSDKEMLHTNCATFPGYEGLIDELLSLATIMYPSAAPTAVLLTGSKGVGLTSMAACIANELVRLSDSPISPIVRNVSAKDILLAAASFIDIKDLIDFVLTPAKRNPEGRRILIIDDLDSVFGIGGEEDLSSHNPERVLAMNAILGAVDTLVEEAAVAVVGDNASKASSVPPPFILGLCCASTEQITSDLVRVGRFEKIVAMSAPTQYQREQLFRAMLAGMPIDVDASEGQSRQSLAMQWAQVLAPRTSGFVASDIRRVCTDALTRAQSRYLCAQMPTPEALGNYSVLRARVQWEDIREAARICVPSLLARLDVTSASIFHEDDIFREELWVDYKAAHEKAWSVFGGYKEVKERVYRTIVSPWSHQVMRQAIEKTPGPGDAQVMQASKNLTWGISPPSGVLFHGESGCGKTMAAYCLATALALPVVKVGTADIFDQWLGGSEAAVRSLFARARSAAPCVLFFDDIDALACNREDVGDSTNVQSRILSTLLNEMDGVSSQSGRGGVLVVAATNRLEAIDSALLRPGRLERHIELLLPTASDIEEILRIHLAKVRLGKGVIPSDLAVRLGKIGASGADVEGVCTGACLYAIRRASSDVSSAGEGIEADTIALEMDDFASALRAVFPEIVV